MKARIRELLHASPFQPFIIRLADGRDYRIDHPDYVLAAATDIPQITIEEPDGTQHFLSALLVTSIERVARNGAPVEKERVKLSNHRLQARPGFAWLFVLRPWPGLPEPQRWLCHEVAFGAAWRSKPDQALRVAAGTPRKHASDGLSRGRGYRQGCNAFPGEKNKKKNK